MIESIRKDKRSVLLLDCGALFNDQLDTAELHLKAMERMGYDALNLGGSELHFGKEFLERTHSRVSFPYIASNLHYGGGRLPWIPEYIIKEAGGIKVAILGILDPADLTKILRRDNVKGFEVIPPEAALKRLLPEVRVKSDLVILLSQFDAEQTLALVKAVKGIDVAISSGDDYDYDLFLAKAPENTVLLKAGPLGRTLGLLKITLDKKRAPTVSERKDVLLENSVPDNEEIAGLVEMHKNASAIKQQKVQEELMEGLQMSLEQFMEHNRKEQTKSE